MRRTLMETLPCTMWREKNNLKMLDVLKEYKPKLYCNNDGKAALQVEKDNNYNAIVNILKHFDLIGMLFILLNL